MNPLVPRPPASPATPSRTPDLGQYRGMSQDADALERAIALACRAHRGQRYPSPEAEPYILHPLRVMFAVQGSKAQTAAVLHDVLEDTEVNVDQLRQARIPDDVIAAVVALTHRAEHTYDQYIEQVAHDRLARNVKLADLADNLANNYRLNPSPDVTARIDRYQRAIQRLQAVSGQVPRSHT
jgi:(p)ppGpp synthase/HD superfamily hydrolase